MEDHEIPNGWPLGLEVMNMRLRVVDSLPRATVEHYSLPAPSALYFYVYAVEDHEIPNGWPFGLEIMNMRFRVVDSLPRATVERYSLHAPSTSFSSFLSSDLDTESTASFFQDHGVSLGRLIRIRSGDRGRLYFPNSIHFEEHGRLSRTGSQSDASRGDGDYMCRG